MIRIVYDPAKRDRTLAERGLDFADAWQLFAGVHATRQDIRKDYGELRFQTFGWLHGRAAVVAWTPRGEDRRVISMRHAHEQEARIFELGGSG